jgi:hypothetical protein
MVLFCFWVCIDVQCICIRLFFVYALHMLNIELLYDIYSTYIICMYVSYVCMYHMYVCIICMYVLLGQYYCMYHMYVCIICMYVLLGQYYCMYHMYVCTSWSILLYVSYVCMYFLVNIIVCIICMYVLLGQYFSYIFYTKLTVNSPKWKENIDLFFLSGIIKWIIVFKN